MAIFPKWGWICNIQGDGCNLLIGNAASSDRKFLPDTLLLRVAGAMLQMESKLAQGALVTIEPGRSRIRMLPLRKGN